MKIYIGNQEVQDSSIQKILDVQTLQYVADNNECNQIIVDNNLRRVNQDQLYQVAQIIVSKLRIDGRLIINDIDSDLLGFYLYKNGDGDKIAKTFFPASNFLTYQQVVSIFNSLGLTLIGKNIQGLNFIVEFIRSK